MATCADQSGSVWSRYYPKQIGSCSERKRTIFKYNEKKVSLTFTGISYENLAQSFTCGFLSSFPSTRKQLKKFKHSVHV